MSAGAFASMTYLPEFRDLLANWRQEEETRLIQRLRGDILNFDDLTQARRVAFASGFLDALTSFDRFIDSRIRAEQGLSGQKETPNALQKLRRG
jgi:hypothetical protein